MQHQQHVIGMETYISNDNSIWCSHYGKLFPIRKRMKIESPEKENDRQISK